MIEVQRSGALCRMVLNRPDKANALTREMLADLRDAARSAVDAQVVVLTGAGKVFSAGADLAAAKEGLAINPVWEELSAALAALPGLTIAALNGSLAGGAFGMALACDLRIAVPEAKFFYPVMKLGFLPQPSDPPRLAKLVGPARAKLILLGGARILADEALAIGLVDRVVPREDLESAVETLAADALSATSAHVAAIKAII